MADEILERRIYALTSAAPEGVTPVRMVQLTDIFETTARAHGVRIGFGAFQNSTNYARMVLDQDTPSSAVSDVMADVSKQTGLTLYLAPESVHGTSLTLESSQPSAGIRKHAILMTSAPAPR